MAERKAEEEQLAMEKALRERRWRAAGHIQRFWQGYKVRKVIDLSFLSAGDIEASAMFSLGSQSQEEEEERQRQRRQERRQGKKMNEDRFLFIHSFSSFARSTNEFNKSEGTRRSSVSIALVYFKSVQREYHKGQTTGEGQPCVSSSHRMLHRRSQWVRLTSTSKEAVITIEREFRFE